MKNEPIIVAVTNTSKTSSRKAIIFGYKDFLNTTNLGSDLGIDIISHPKDYEELLKSTSKPFTIELIRLTSINLLQLRKNILLTYTRGSDLFQTPISVEKHLAEERFDKKTVDIPVNIVVDEDTFFSYSLEPNTTVNMYLFPKE